jgi:hypothetical protein
MTREIIYDNNALSMLDICHTTVLFRGGQGGNFLNYIIKKHTCKPDSYRVEKTNKNEFINPDTHDIVHAHVNLFFRTVDKPYYGEEVYTISRLKKMLDAIESKKTTMIVLTNNSDIAWTETLGYLKTGNGMLTLDSIYLNFFNCQNNKKYQYNDPNFQDWGRIYNWLYKILKKRTNAILIEYKDLFIECKKETSDGLADFCGIQDKDSFYNEIKDYSEKNIKLMKDQGLEWKN